MERFYYSNTINNFLTESSNEIIGQLTQKSIYDINDKTRNSWEETISVMKDSLIQYKNRGSIYFEYNIPRMGRRADIIVLIDNIVFVLEFKTADQKFSREATNQVWDYAIDLKNFQEGSLNRFIVPILVVPKETTSKCQLDLILFEDGVYKPLLSNSTKLQTCFEKALKQHKVDSNIIWTEADDHNWAISGYEPTPTIIEAAIALYEHHTVEDITKHSGDIVRTTQRINDIIIKSKQSHRKSICFITGVPGAGKTLIGLQTAIKQFEKEEKAVYLSGNFPLVEVLQEALARDYVKRSKLKYKQGLTTEKPCTKVEARSKVKAFIQMVHHYRNLYLEGTKIENNHIVPIKKYFNSLKDSAYIPTEPVAIFDEAQRAWTKEELCRFMKEKHHIANFPYSEPEYLISCLDRRQDWAVIICLIGGGQEINKGEAGLIEWLKALNRNFSHWDIYLSDHLSGKEYIDGDINDFINTNTQINWISDLHLSVNMRSFRAEKVSLFVQQLLDLKPLEATKTLKQLKNYPIVLTRSLDTAKKWLKDKARGNERYGLLASSKAERLKAININVRYQPDFVHWFLEEDNDIRSSNRLEDTLTEFKVQGLEIDWACVIWDADLRLSTDYSKWEHFQLRSGTKWQHINKGINQQYQINAYRVLLTRARQGMIIVIPEGDNSIPPDVTRKPEWYDNTYNYLKSLGIKTI